MTETFEIGDLVAIVDRNEKNEVRSVILGKVEGTLTDSLLVSTKVYEQIGTLLVGSMGDPAIYRVSEYRYPVTPDKLVKLATLDEWQLQNAYAAVAYQYLGTQTIRDRI